MTRYELGERIGVGGMAEIFRGKAVAAGGFEKPVAIKRILPHLSQDERFVNLLIAEAKILSQLRHRNVVQIFDVGLGEDGHYFLVMEFVDGTDLGALYGRLESARKRLPLDLALHIGAEVCEALEHAHLARGTDGEPLNIVHRDVSPGNILLSLSGEVKLGDFGIAKHTHGEATGHGGVRGKFAYISPEQAANLRVDARSDVYAVGVVLTELVTGRRLLSALPDFDALRAVRDGRMLGPRDLDPEMTPELEEILTTAMAREPQDRYPTAGKLGQALRSYRYSLSLPGGDPAKELARVIARFPPERENVDHEPTVVRIHTAAGFTVTGLDSFAGDGVDDDEQTHAVAAHRLPSWSPQPITPATPAPSDTPLPPSIEARNPERAATPTVRDLFGAEMVEEDPGPPAAAARARPPQRRLMSDAEQLSRPRKRRLALLIAAVVVVALGSFLVAGFVLRGDGDSDADPAAAALPDAAPAVVDAGSPDAAVKKARPKPKKKRTRKKPAGKDK